MLAQGEGYAVVMTGGKQYRVAVGDVVNVERLEGQPGDEVTLDRVLAVKDAAGLKLGQPVVDGATVKGTIVHQGKGKKIIVFKHKRRKSFRRTKGHRQLRTTLTITAITA